jgi:hypothetical protein
MSDMPRLAPVNDQDRLRCSAFDDFHLSEASGRQRSVQPRPQQREQVFVQPIVRLYRDAAEVRGRDLFVCSIREWQFLQELARTFGWHPSGTTYELPVGSRIVDAARRNYEPGATNDKKTVSTEDAIAWARALERAQKSAHFDALARALVAHADETSRTTENVAHWLAEFIQYAFGGAFAFAFEESTD